MLSHLLCPHGRGPTTPLHLVDDVLLAILCLLDPAELAACANASRHLFRLSAPLLWQHGSVNDALRWTDPFELVNRDPTAAVSRPCRPEWRLAIYLRSIRAIDITSHTPVEVMPWLGRLDAVRLQSDTNRLIPEDASLPSTLQRWLDAVLERLREGRGPSTLEIAGAFRWRDMFELLSFPSVKVVKLCSVAVDGMTSQRPERELVPLLNHGVEELTASVGFACRYRRSNELRRLVINDSRGRENELRPRGWNLPALAHLEITSKHEREFLLPLLVAVKETLLTLKINDGPLNESEQRLVPLLTRDDFTAMANCTNLDTLVIRVADRCFDSITNLSALASLRQLTILPAATTPQPMFIAPPVGLVGAIPAIGQMLQGMVSLTHLSISRSYPGRNVLRLNCRNLISIKLKNIHAVVDDYDRIKAEGWPALRTLNLQHSVLSAEEKSMVFFDILEDEGFERMLSSRKLRPIINSQGTWYFDGFYGGKLGR